jgi:putative redox protein
MADVRVKWAGGRTFIGVDSTSHSLVMSSGEEGIGLKPSDVLLISLGGCTGYDVVNILEKRREKVTGFEMTFQTKRDDKPPHTFREIEIEYVFHGHGLTPKSVERAIELSHSKYCSVGATLRGTAKITHTYKIVEEADS